MLDFFITLFCFLIALLILFWFYGSLLPAFFNLNKYRGEDDLPLDMIYKSDEEVEEYRKIHNIKID